jgi:hypothetical protein
MAKGIVQLTLLMIVAIPFLVIVGVCAVLLNASEHRRS